MRTSSRLAGSERLHEAASMDIKDIANLKLGPLEALVARIYHYAKRFPLVRNRIDAE